MDNIIDYLTPVSEIESEETQWLISHWIPKGGITLLAGDGGVGKTSLWCYLLARLSQGCSTFLSAEPEEDMSGEQFGRKVLYFSAEDSTARTLKTKLAGYGAEMANIQTVDMSHLADLKYDSPALEAMILETGAEVCVFDPIQAFMPKGKSMTSRQDAREALNNLVRLGTKYGTAFILVCHTNKKKTDDWRVRISGSADLPDIARSVLFTDYTELAPGHAIRFLSNEKNSYHTPQDTVLYTLEDGLVRFHGISGKKFADYARSTPFVPTSRSKPTQKNQAKALILEELEKGEASVSELDALLEEKGIGRRAVQAAKAELVNEGSVVRFAKEEEMKNRWYVKRAE